MLAIDRECNNRPNLPLDLSPALHREGHTSVKVTYLMSIHHLQIFCNYSDLKSNAITSSVYCKVIQIQNSHILLLCLHFV